VSDFTFLKWLWFYIKTKSLSCISLKIINLKCEMMHAWDFCVESIHCCLKLIESFKPTWARLLRLLAVEQLISLFHTVTVDTSLSPSTVGIISWKCPARDVKQTEFFNEYTIFKRLWLSVFEWWIKVKGWYPAPPWIATLWRCPRDPRSYVVKGSLQGLPMQISSGWGTKWSAFQRPLKCQIHYLAQVRETGASPWSKA